MFFEYPKTTIFGRKIPKNKFYEKVKFNSKLKNKFINQIDKIIWQYKLASNTINLEATIKVPEIDILDLYLKTKDLDLDILNLIDKAIPLPIIFQIHFENKIKLIATYKRPSDSEKNKWIFDRYFESDWESNNVVKKPLPQALNLEKLYESLITEIIPSQFRSNEKIENKIDNINQANTLKKEIMMLEMKYRKEKQPNRQFEINKKIKIKCSELEKLMNKD